MRYEVAALVIWHEFLTSGIQVKKGDILAQDLSVAAALPDSVRGPTLPLSLVC
jgi:hypothetical protein